MRFLSIGIFLFAGGARASSLRKQRMLGGDEDASKGKARSDKGAVSAETVAEEDDGGF